jgi:hypothetical protein
MKTNFCFLSVCSKQMEVCHFHFLYLYIYIYGKRNNIYTMGAKSIVATFFGAPR